MPPLLISIKVTQFLLLSGTLPLLLDSSNFKIHHTARKTILFMDDIILSQER